MSTLRDLKAYRFTSPAHWQAGTLSKISIQGNGAIMPKQPLAPVPRFMASPGGAFVPAIDPYGVAYWRTGTGMLQWAGKMELSACSIEAPAEIASSPRLVVGRMWMWAFLPGTATLIRYDLESFQQDGTIFLKDSIIRDIAADGNDGVWLLVGNEGVPDRLCHVDAKGRVGKPWSLPSSLAHPKSLIYLTNAVQAVQSVQNGSDCGHAEKISTGRIVLLTEKGDVLAFLDPENHGPVVQVTLRQVAKEFVGYALDSDQSSCILVTGGMRLSSLGKESTMVLLLDSTGGLLDQIPASQFVELRDYLPITGATAHGSTVLLTTARGLLWFDAAPAGNSVDAEGVFLSPVLYSPETGSLRGWLRAELSAVLPKGSILSVTVMGTDALDVRNEVTAVLQNASLSPRDRQLYVEDKLKIGRTGPFVFRSPEDDPMYPQASSAKPTLQKPSWYAAPLFDHHQPWLWLEVRISAAPDGRLPELHELCVLYPEVSLAQHVPAIFRSDTSTRDPLSGDPTGFFRQLIGILETTTQGIDRTISTLGSRIHPATAQGEWLDFIARWQDLPWDDALPENLKRSILGKAALLLAHRGTRAGLETLLLLLFPQGKFRVIDVNVDVGLATLGGEHCVGSALPALLSGLPAHSAALSRKALLGSARLTCPNEDPTGIARFMRLLRIDIIASMTERKIMEPVLPGLLAAVVPAGLRIEIRWRAGTDLRLSRRLGEGIILDDPSARRLGQDARLGQLALASGGHLRLEGTVLNPGFRLK